MTPTPSPTPTTEELAGRLEVLAAAVHQMAKCLTRQQCDLVADGLREDVASSAARGMSAQADEAASVELLALLAALGQPLAEPLPERGEPHATLVADSNLSAHAEGQPRSPVLA